jgi:hypothetical protein
LAPGISVPWFFEPSIGAPMSDVAGDFCMAIVPPGTEADDIYLVLQIIYESFAFWRYNRNNLRHNTLSVFR